MSSIGETSIVYNNPNKIVGLPPYYYRLRRCNTILTGFTPADQYQKQKLIQNTVRVYSSLYTSNLGPLNAYKKPLAATYGVCWNQMSDRPVPSVQKATIPTGYNNSLNRRHSSVTSSKPGSQTPGGIGCDIKHNSYDRYLNRLKGKGPLRRGVIPPTFGAPIYFNPAFPVYGGKTVKTNIVSGCDCPIFSQQNNLKQDIKVYNNPYWQPYPTSIFEFEVGDYVYAKKTDSQYYTRALIISINEGIYTIQFDDGTEQTVDNVNDLLTYFPCNCNAVPKTYLIPNNLLIANYSQQIGLECNLPVELLLS
jgi:hypothetical protein